MGKKVTLKFNLATVEKNGNGGGGKAVLFVTNSYVNESNQQITGNLLLAYKDIAAMDVFSEFGDYEVTIKKMK